MVWLYLALGLVLLTLAVLIFPSSTPRLTELDSVTEETEPGAQPTVQNVAEPAAVRCPLRYVPYDGRTDKDCTDFRDCDPDGRKWRCNDNWRCEKDGVESAIQCRNVRDCLRTGRNVQCKDGTCISRQRLRRCRQPTDCVRNSREQEEMFDCRNGYCVGPEIAPQPFKEGAFSCGLEQPLSLPGLVARRCPSSAQAGARCRVQDTTSPFRIKPDYPGGRCIPLPESSDLWCLPESLCVPDAQTTPTTPTGICKPFLDVMGDAPVRRQA